MANVEQSSSTLREAQLRTRLDSGLRLLLGEMQQGRSENLLHYLAFTSRFQKYSAQNQMLIFLQSPDATFVAGYRRWQELGYQVRKGEKAIQIYAPSVRKRVNSETGEEEESVRFLVVNVFDASQLANLEEKPLPAFFKPLPDDQQSLVSRLKEAIQADGIQVDEERLGQSQGVSRGRRIAIRAGTDSRNQLLTLIHEYAHELLHWSVPGRQQKVKVKECHAEAVSYVVAYHYGIHNPFSADYLQHWGNTTTDLLAELDVVRQTAAYIVDRMEATITPSAQTPNVSL